MNTPEAYPLQWPAGRPRTKRPRASRFDTSMTAARDGLLNELRLLGARYVVISTNIRTYVRGGQEIPYADQSQAKEDPGVAVYFQWKGESFAFACDKWRKVGDNLQAIRKTIEALRGLERWGTGDMVRAAFTGFKALPEQGSGRPWWVVLEVDRNASFDAVRAAYRRRARDTHPDTGGTEIAFHEVQEAWKQAQATLNHAQEAR